MQQWLIFYGIAAGVAAGVFAWPVSRALLATLAALRDPNVASAPESPWIMFKRIFGFKIRRWFIVWPSVLAGSYFFFFGSHSSRSGFPVWIDAVNALNAPGMLGGLGLTIGASVFLWAPRCKETWSLVAVGSGVGIGVYVAAAYLVYVLFPGELLLMELGAPFVKSGGGAYVVTYFLILLMVGAVAAGVAMAWVKWKTRRWVGRGEG